jgi:hypothetical protein
MPTKVKIVTTAMPGRTSGSTTDQRVRSIDAPSVQALSSMSVGTPSKKFLVRNSANGIEDVARNRIAPGIESMRLIRTNIA